jgi:hypothetical protein
MAIVGVLANAMSQDTGGAIVQNFATLTHNFGPSSIWGHPSLQMMETLDDDAFATVHVTQFVDAAGVHNVNNIGQFASNKCTSITYTLIVGLASARSLCITEFFG